MNKKQEEAERKLAVHRAAITRKLGPEFAETLTYRTMLEQVMDGRMTCYVLEDNGIRI